MCRNPVLWPQGKSFCGDQSKSSWLLPRSTYWHIQMPSVYCENRSIGWNNTVTGDNVPERDDLWSSFGCTDSGAVTPQATAISVTLLMPPPPLHTPQRGTVFFFLSLVSQQPPLLPPPTPSPYLPFFFFHTPVTPSSLFSHSLPNNRNLIFLVIAAFPLRTSPFHPQPLASADCQCLQVICGHFSFITLSKSGTALARGDWVSVKHQDLIEFVLKWVI